MASDPRTFIGHCITGTAKPEDIDDWIERWHTSATGMELHDYLGLSWEEYGNLVSAPDALPHIIEIRRMVEMGRASLVAAVAGMSGKLN